MTCIAAPEPRPRRLGRATTASTASTAPSATRRPRRDRARARRAPSRRTCPPKDAVILRGARGARLGGGADPAQRASTAATAGRARSAAGAARSSRASASTSPTPGGRARGSCADARGRAGPRRRRAGRRRRGSRSADGRTPRRSARPRSSSRRARSGRPAILERSGVEHPAIGRYLRLHPVSVVGRVHARRGRRCGGAPLQAARSLEWLGAREPGGNGYVIESAPGHPGLIALALPVGGRRPAHAEIMSRRPAHRAAHRDRRATAARGRRPLDGEWRRPDRLPARRVEARHAAPRPRRDGPPRPGGRARRDRRGRDAAGLVPARAAAPMPRSAAFAAYLERPAPRSTSGRTAGWSSRPTRWAPSGWAPTRGPSVSTERGRVRSDARGDASCRGLYVGDGSLFPTAIGVNPMITIMALARRVARTVLAESRPAAGRPSAGRGGLRSAGGGRALGRRGALAGLGSPALDRSRRRRRPSPAAGGDDDRDRGDDDDRGDDRPRPRSARRGRSR